MNNKISVVVLTKNEEENIVDCLESVSFADEIVIIDDNSSDRTVELAKKYTDKIFNHELNNNFASQRNFALNHVHNPWILFIDADEIVSENLKEEIQQAIKKPLFNGFYIKRVDYVWNRTIKHGEGGSVTLLRLAKKGAGKWRGRVHEVWRVNGETKILTSPLIHRPHSSVKSFVSDIDEYTEIRAEELHEQGKESNWFFIISYPIGKFVVDYLFKGGYKDGVAGFIYATIMSMHSFLVRAKLYLLSK